jgi:hypothetical protein
MDTAKKKSSDNKAIDTVKKGDKESASKAKKVTIVIPGDFEIVEKKITKEEKEAPANNIRSKRKVIVEDKKEALANI